MAISLALLGLAAGGAAASTDLSPAPSQRVAAQPAFLDVVPGEVTPVVQREAVGVRSHDVEKKARQDALDRAVRELAARQLAAKQLAAKLLAAKQLAASQAAAAARASRSTYRAPAVSPGSARAIAQGMLASYGWSASEFDCLDPLWMRESGWRVDAANPSSGAYGIPQALPGSKMATVGADWQTNATTQITWGLGYIRDRYGSPCGAWSHFQSHNWY